MTPDSNDSPDFYCHDHLVDQPPTIHRSPSGRFRLEIRHYRTRPNCWCYSRGTVIREADGAVVADVRRNYSTFHFSFITKDERELLVTGRSYMGQTIIDLDLAQAWNDPKWPDGYEGHEFCWAASELCPDGRTLLVDGCHWACPYEYRFYDLTDPARGWPELPIRDPSGDDTWLPADDGRPPELAEDGTVTCFETSRVFVPLRRHGDELTADERAAIGDEAWQDPASWQTVVDRRVLLVREADHMRITEDWRSDDRIRREREAAEREAAEQAMHEEASARAAAEAIKRHLEA